MGNRLARAADLVRGSFWFLPGVLLVASAVLATLVLQADRAHDGTWGGLLYNGGPDGARVLLGTIAGSMVTVGTTVFSITMVALTLASSQFGPRMLSNFLRDRGNQLTIGLFIAVFLYSLLVLRAIPNEPAGVPNLAVSLALLLASAALMVLIYFIHHIATSIQVMNLVQLLADDLRRGLDSTLPPADAAAQTGGEARPAVSGSGYAVAARGSGYVQLVDDEVLMAAATEHDLLVELVVRPGRFAVEGTPVAWVWRVGGGSPPDARIIEGLAAAVAVGPRRSVVQDVEFPLRQLVEVALRALSPGINDPVTATACLNQLSVALCAVADRPMPPATRADESGTTRLVQVDPVTFPRLVAVAFDQIRQAASGHVVVHLHLLEALTRVAGRTRHPDRIAALRHQGDLVWERAGQVVAQAADLEVVRGRYDALLTATARTA
jgi:uncharacterized membrane protein